MKGRLLDHQLDSHDNGFQLAINECHEILSSPSLINEDLIANLLTILDGKGNHLPLRNDISETYPHLLTSLEVLMYIEKNRKLIEALIDDHPVKVAILSIESKLVELLSIEVQWKEFPKKIPELDFDLILINYSDQAVPLDALNMQFIREQYAKFNQSPVVLKCGEDILCYGIELQEIKGKKESIEKITSLDATKFSGIKFPTEMNVPEFLGKNKISDDIQKELTEKDAHDIFTHHIYNKLVKKYVFDYRRLRVSANVAQMLLNGFLRIVDSLSTSEKLEYSVRRITHILNNSRYSPTSLLHLKKSQGGSEYDATNNKKNWLGLIKILNYVFNDENVKKSKVGKQFASYLESLRWEDKFFNIIFNNNGFIPKNEQDLKDAKKNVIRNVEGPLFFLNQNIPDRKRTPQDEVTQQKKEFLENMRENLNVDWSSKYAPEVTYNDNNEALFYFPKSGKVFNATEIMKKQPQVSHIHFTPAEDRYVLSAMTGCSLYFLQLNENENIEKYIERNPLPAHSCVLLSHKKSKNEDQKENRLKELYYVNANKEMEWITNENNICAEIEAAIKDSEWIPNKLNNNDDQLIKISSSNEKTNKKKLFSSIDEILTNHQLISLEMRFIVSPPTKLLSAKKHHPGISTVSDVEAASITLYTSAFYVWNQEIERGFNRVNEKTFDLNLLSTEKKMYIDHYFKKLGNHFFSDPKKLYVFLRDINLFNHYITHGLTTITERNEDISLEKIKSNLNYKNCNLYLVSNEEDMEKCKNKNQGQGIILYKRDRDNKLIIRHCIDDSFVKKIMKIDLEVEIDVAQFLNNLSDGQNEKSNKFMDLALLTRNKIGRVIPKNKQQRLLVNDFIHYAMWYCKLNTYDKQSFHGDLPGFYVELIRPQLIEKIKTDGIFFSSANEFYSSSIGVCKGFVDEPGTIYLTVIHLAEEEEPVVIPLSASAHELELIIGPDKRLVYFKVQKLFGCVILHAFPVKIDKKLEHLVNAQLIGEIYTSIEFTRNNIKSNEQKISFTFNEFMNAAAKQSKFFSPDDLKRIEPCFTSIKNANSHWIQMSCLDGTAIDIMNVMNGVKKNNSTIFLQVKQYAIKHELKNTYVIVPIKNSTQEKSKSSTLSHFKLYYVEGQQNIVEIMINDFESASQLSAFLEDLRGCPIKSFRLDKAKNKETKINNDLNVNKEKRLAAKSYLKLASLYYLDKLITNNSLDRKNYSFPLLLGLKENLTKNKNSLSPGNMLPPGNRLSHGNRLSTEKPSLMSSFKHTLNPSPRKSYAADNTVSSEAENKLEELHSLILQKCSLQEELENRVKELKFNSKTEEEIRNHENFNKKNAISLGNQFIEVMKGIGEDKHNKLFKHFNLALLENIVNCLEKDNRTDLFLIIKNHLNTLLTVLTDNNRRKKFYHRLENKMGDALFLYLCIKICKAYPADAKKAGESMHNIICLQDKIITFEFIQQIIKKNIGIEITEVSEFTKQEKSKKVNQRFLKLVTENYDSYVNAYPDVDKRKLQQLKRIITLLQKPSFTEADKMKIDKSHFEVNEILMQHEKEQNERFIRQIPTQEELDYFNILNYFRILLDPLVTENIFSQHIATHLSLTNALPQQKIAKPVASKQKIGVKPTKKNTRTPPKPSTQNSPRSHTPEQSKVNSPRLLPLPLETTNILSVASKKTHKSPKQIESPKKSIPQKLKSSPLITASFLSGESTKTILRDTSSSFVSYEEKELIISPSFSGIKLFDKHPAQGEPTIFTEVKELIEAIESKNVDKVDFILSQMEGDTKKLRMILSGCVNGQTPLHVSILQLQNVPLKKVKLNNLEESIILTRLLTAHVKAEIKITNAHHLNHNKLSPMQLAMSVDEKVALFLAAQYENARQNKLVITTPKI